ncbi:MAG: hypothetical protein H6891_13545 [Brucellaceae bacterium]|nr:hypothetical protein [Brucellaceae bacterium]
MRPGQSTIRSVAGAAAFLVAVTHAGGALADGRDVVESWVAGAGKAGYFDVSHDGISDEGGNRTTVTGLTLSVDAMALATEFLEKIGQPPGAANAANKVRYTLRFPSVTFTGLREEDGAYAANRMEAATMEAEFVLDGGPDIGTWTRGTYSRLAIDGLEIAGLPVVEISAENPFSQFVPLITGLVDFSFDNAIIEKSSSRSRDAEGAEMLQETGRMVAGRTVRGDISTVSVDGLKMTMPVPDAPGDSITFSVGPVAAQNYNYGTALRTLLAPEGAPDVYRPAIGSLTIGDIGLSSTNDLVEGAIDIVAINDWEVRAPAMPLVAVADDWARRATADPSFEPDEQEIVQFVASIYGAFRLGGFAMSGIRGEVAGAGSMRIGQVAVQELSADGLGVAMLNGLEVDGVNGERVRYGQSLIGGVEFPELAALMNLEEAQRKGDIAAMLKAVPKVGHILNSGIEVKIPAEGIDAGLSSSQLVMGGHIGPIPTRVDARFEGLRVPVSVMDREPRELFQGLGYDTFEGSAAVTLAWNEGDQSLAANVDAALADGGRLSGQALIGNVPKVVFEMPGPGSAIALFGATLGGLNVAFEDDSIVDRGLTYAAARQGTDKATVANMVKGLVPFALTELKKPQLVEQASRAVTTLLDGGKRITLSASSGSPMPIAALLATARQNPAAALSTIDIRIDAE